MSKATEVLKILEAAKVIFQFTHLGGPDKSSDWLDEVDATLVRKNLKGTPNFDEITISFPAKDKDKVIAVLDKSVYKGKYSVRK